MFNTFLTYQPKNKTELYQIPDTEKKFLKNLKKEKDDWVYRNKKITYIHNEFGFRSKFFHNIDWSKYVVIIGCSNVYGIGLAYEDTFECVLEKKLNTPVINLGIPGASVELSFYNSLFLNLNNFNPKALIHIWTSLDRYTNIINNDYIENFLPRSSKYYSKINWKNKSMAYIYADQKLWENKTMYYQASFYESTASELNVKKFDIIDLARDGVHPGINSIINASEDIYKSFCFS
jgi:hypothetical protein